MFHKCFPSHFVNYSDSNRLTKPLVGRYRAADDVLMTYILRQKSLLNARHTKKHNIK